MMNKEIKGVNCSIILIEPKVEGNIGAIARVCNNFNATELVLISPQVDYLSEEAKNRARHSKHYLENARVFSDFQNVRDHYEFLIGTSAKAGKTYNVYRQPAFSWEWTDEKFLLSSKIGIVFGREDRGLSNKELSLCDYLVNIPVPGEQRVLNISHAVAIILYEVWKRTYKVVDASELEIVSVSKEREMLITLFESLVNSMDYEEYRKPNVIHAFRSILNRSFASKEEIHALIGMFKTILEQNQKSKQ
ncbi:MAG: RNA methyltransferase [Candidatus Heimdallarchaeaceae archaeon]